MTLSADDILSAEDLPREKVLVPEWGGEVIVQGLSSVEADRYDRQLIRVDQKTGATSVANLDNIRALLVAKCLVDEDGKRIFKDSDVAALGKKSSAAIARVWTVARRLSGMDEETTEEVAAGFGEAQDVAVSSA